MKNFIKTTIFFGCLIFCTAFTFAQEALKSIEEEYFEMLSLMGITERPTLSYKTLSDNTFNFIEEIDEDTLDGDDVVVITPNHPWKNHVLNPLHTLWENENPKHNYYIDGVKQGIYLKIYGPEWYNSYNTAAPFGWYDGALWQGKGYNTSLTGGARLEGYGLEITIKPKINFSLNLEFDYLKPRENTSNVPGGFKDPIYSGKADTYGYFYGSTCDAPQRFGDKPFWAFEWGDTEIRYTWRCWTIGFGTQPIWLGPNYVNPLLLSNNAASFPKIDFGIRKQKIILPWIHWDIGYVEARIWTGFLTESDFFDSRSDNDHNLIHGLSLSYAPSFIPGLTLGANRICLVKASWENMGYIIPVYSNTHLGEKDAGEDQKMSLTADWYFPSIQFEVYGELGIDDFLPSGESYVQGYLRWPFHTASYSIGVKKGFNFKKHDELKGLLVFEWNNTEPSQDYQMWAAYNFGHHGQILQGYTNRGEWLGSGIGYGGNSQYLSYTLYYPQGNTTVFIGRFNPDNTYVYGQAVHTTAVDKNGNYMVSAKYLTSFKAHAYIGAETNYFVTPALTLGGGLLYDLIINPKYNPEKDNTNRYRINKLVHNFQFKLTAKYSF